MTSQDTHSGHPLVHKVLAFERGTYGDAGELQGYAARCETCGAATFGGFASKSAASSSLLHHASDAPYQTRSLPGELADHLANKYGLSPKERFELQKRLLSSTPSQEMQIVGQLHRQHGQAGPDK